jgi:hypothetical protein
MDINKAVLHILDFNSNISIYSQNELELKNIDLNKLLFKFVRKVMNDTNQRIGEFYNNSDFLNKLEAYNTGNISFIDFSTDIATKVYQEIFESDNMVSSDMIIVDFTEEGYEYIGFLLLENKKSFIHNVVNDDEGICNEIIENKSLLPSPTQKISTYAVIDRNNLNIIYNDIKRTQNNESVYIFPQKILGCKMNISTKDVINTVTSIINEVAEDNDDDVVDVVTKAKKIIVSNSVYSETFSPFDLAEDIFSDKPVLKQEYQAKLKEANIPISVKIEKKRVVNSSKNQKIRTNTGIEITFPVDYYGNPKFINFINNSDGTISIEMKNIEKIMNK